MSLLLIDLSFSLRDRWEQTLLLAREFQRAPERLDGRKPLLVCPAGSPLANAALAEGLPVFELSKTQGLASVFFSLRRIIRDQQADIVHVFDSLSLVACAMIRRFQAFGLVYTMHSVPQGKPMILNRALAKADRIVFVGGNLAGEMGKLEVSPSKARVILPAFMEEHLTRTAPCLSHPASPSHFVFVAACELSPEKDLGALLQAMAYLQNMAIDLPPWEVRIVGKGAMFEELLESASKMGVLSRLSLLGDQDRNAIIGSADAVVSSSVSGAGDVPLILDAWSRDLPVACTALKAHAQMGKDKEHFLLTEPGKPIPLAGSMLRLMTEPQTRQNIAAGGREALPRFMPSRMADEYTELYLAVLADEVPQPGAPDEPGETDEDSELAELQAMAAGLARQTAATPSSTEKY